MLKRAAVCRFVKTNPKCFSRRYARDTQGFDLAGSLGMGPDGIPEVMVIPGIAGEFATQFFRESYQRGGDRIAKAFEVELNVLTWSVRDDADWDIATTSPFVGLEDKEKFVRQKCEQLKLSPFFITRVINLLQSDDLSRLEQIRADYAEIMRIYRRERQVTLVTGPSVSQQEVDFLKTSVKQNYLQPAESMVFSHQVDPSILGGMKVIIDGTEHDHSWTQKQIEETSTNSYSVAYGPISAKPSRKSIYEAKVQELGITLEAFPYAVDAQSPKSCVDLANKRRQRVNIIDIITGRRAEA